MKNLGSKKLLGATWRAAVLTLVVLGTFSHRVQAQANESNGQSFAPQVDEYVVEEGDTLWDISERVVGNPFLWPKVWAMNPEISNPHWIYPGDMIRFYPPELELPSITQLVARTMQVEPAVVKEIEESEQVASKEVKEKAPAVEVISTVPIARQTVPKRFTGLFVTARELQEAGTLSNAAPDRMMLMPGDRVFIKMNTPPSAQGRYLIYRTVKAIHHPISQELVGYITEITGTANAAKNLRAPRGMGENVFMAVLDQTWVEVERGQKVAPLAGDLSVQLKRVPSTAQVDATVLGINRDMTMMAGTHDLIFIDKGTDDGLVVGNHMAIMGPRDPYGVSAKNIETGGPDTPETDFEEIARIHVVDARPNAATCLVLHSIREILPGNHARTVMN